MRRDDHTKSGGGQFSPWRAKQRAGIVCAVYLALGLVGANSLCAKILTGPITNSANQHVYYLLTPSSWTAAEAESVSLGGHLVTLNNPAEHQWVRTNFSSFGGVPRHLWIGLYRVNFRTGFAWVSGETPAYQNWAWGEPNNCDGIENRGIIFGATEPFLSVAGFWNDISDSGIGGAGGGDLAPSGVVEVVPPKSQPTPEIRTVITKLEKIPPTDNAANLAIAPASSPVIAMESPLVLQTPISLRISVSAVDVCWNSVPGKNYQVEYRSELTTNAWVTLGARVLADSANTCVTESVSGQLSRFYRVRVLE